MGPGGPPPSQKANNFIVCISIAIVNVCVRMYVRVCTLLCGVTIQSCAFFIRVILVFFFWDSFAGRTRVKDLS